MYNDIEVLNTMNTEHCFVIDEINILSIINYPVKLIYEQDSSGFGNILEFETKESLSEFLMLRKYMLERINVDGRKPGKIRIYE